MLNSRFSGLAPMITFAFTAAACSAQPSSPKPSGTGPFAPALTRSFEDFGAVGDGHSDDTAAVARALGDSDRYCLDGQGRTYRVTGTLRVSRNLCLRNTTLVQSAVPEETAAYINRSCPKIQNPSVIIDCKDPAIASGDLSRLWTSLSIRTLLIRPAGGRPLRINLDRVKVDRGPHAESGSRSDSAGIWIDGADRVDLGNVEITGDGKGYGLFITNAHNVTLTSLWIHDLVWAPYRGDKPLSEAGIAAVGWNSVPIHEFREQGRDGAVAAKFYGVRIQEQLTCAALANVSHVRIENVRIERCMARFDTGNLPWQADGLDIGRSSSDILVRGGKIDSTWEGMDIAAGGDGIQRLQIEDLTISNSFSFGLKMGYQLSSASVSRLHVDGAGLSAVVVYGPVRDMRISRSWIKNVGVIGAMRRSHSPWPPGNRAGIRIDGTAASHPSHIVVEDVAVSGNPKHFEFGILNTGGVGIELVRFRAQGFGIERSRGAYQAMRN